jgi:hypothetical protein
MIAAAPQASGFKPFTKKIVFILTPYDIGEPWVRNTCDILITAHADAMHILVHRALAEQ